MAWENRKLSDVCRLINGRAYKKHEMLSEGPYPLLRVGNFFTNRGWYYSDMELDPDKYCDYGDLLYAWSASFGPKIWDSGKVIYHYHIWKIEIDEELVDKNYLYYLLDWDKELIKSEQGAGTTMVHITKGSMENRILPFPSLEEQKRIVAILDQAFVDIDQARATAETNLKNARELFDSYLEQVFSQKHEGWVQYTMTDICEITSKLVDPRESQYIDLPHIGAGNMISGTGELIDVKTAREEELISGKFVFDNSMVLYSKIRPYLMKVCVPGFDGLCSADVYPLSPVKGIVDKHYLYFLLLSKNFTDYAILGSGRAGMPKVNRDYLFKYKISLPNIEEQKKYVDKLEQISYQSQLLEKLYSSKIDKLDELKKSILHKAFTGELTKSKGIAA